MKNLESVTSINNSPDTFGGFASGGKALRRFPFTPYPRGWFMAGYSDDLDPGAVVPLTMFGQELVLFRTEEGVAHALDAHCPHLGAHLGHGGRVIGSNIRCPFHHWEFDGTGQCAGIPYADMIPSRAAVPSWPVQEANGLLFIHNGRYPSWQVPQFEESESDEWSAYVKRHWRIRTHVQEISENVVDGAHLRYVHNTLTMPETTHESSGHVFRSCSRLKQATPKGPVDGSIHGEAHGLGYYKIRFTGIVDVVFITAATPLNEEEIDLRFTFTYKKESEQGAMDKVGQALIEEICSQLEEDIPIWENKIYRANASFTVGDAPVVALRKWSRQFYDGRPF